MLSNNKGKKLNTYVSDYVIFDLETTGLNPSHDRIVQMSALKINPNGHEEQNTWLINPGVAIPPECSAIHGIYDKDVINQPKFKQVASAISHFLGNSDLAGYNILKFDLPFLMEEKTVKY